MTTNNEHNQARYLNGIPLEKYVTRFFEILGLGSQLDHNNFDPSLYPHDNHNIVDMVIKDKALIELTNPKESTFMDDSIMQDKLDYFTRKDPTHRLLWFLIVSFAVFSDHIKQLIDKLGITLIVLNDYATKTNRQTFIRHLFRSKLYHTAKKLVGKKSKLNSSYQLSITTLPQYVVMSQSSGKAKAILNYLYQHRSTTENTPKEEVKGHIERFSYRPRYDNRPRFS